MKVVVYVGLYGVPTLTRGVGYGWGLGSVDSASVSGDTAARRHGVMKKSLNEAELGELGVV